MRTIPGLLQLPGAVVTGTTYLFNCIPCYYSCRFYSISNCQQQLSVLKSGPFKRYCIRDSKYSGSNQGPASGQCGATGVSYSITPVALATGYSWSNYLRYNCRTYPTSVLYTIDWPASFTTCTLTVSATNACGHRWYTLTGSCRCSGHSCSDHGQCSPLCKCSRNLFNSRFLRCYFIYWTVPSGAVIVGPTTGASILVQWGSTSGSITVKATNACGTSAARSLSMHDFLPHEPGSSLCRLIQC